MRPNAPHRHSPGLPPPRATCSPPQPSVRLMVPAETLLSRDDIFLIMAVLFSRSLAVSRREYQ